MVDALEPFRRRREKELVDRISAVDKWADDNEVNGERLTVYALEEAGFDMADCMWREIMLAWVSFAGVTFIQWPSTRLVMEL